MGIRPERWTVIVEQYRENFNRTLLIFFVRTELRFCKKKYIYIRICINVYVYIFLIIRLQSKFITKTVMNFESQFFDRKRPHSGNTSFQIWRSHFFYRKWPSVAWLSYQINTYVNTYVLFDIFNFLRPEVTSYRKHIMSVWESHRFFQPEVALHQMSSRLQFKNLVGHWKVTPLPVPKIPFFDWTFFCSMVVHLCCWS